MKTTNYVPYIVSGSGVVSAVLGGKQYSIQPDSVYYKKVRAALKENNENKLIRLFDLDAALRKETQGKITFKDGVVMMGGQPLHNAITQRIVQLFKEDFPFEPMLKFLENVVQNPSFKAIDELYGFLEKNTLPITEDGYFLAWKKVGPNFLDIYTGTMDNSPGKEVSMPREKVNPDRHQTCSSGLHVCAHSYLHSYGGNDYGTSHRVVLVKIHPADVVSVPTDYNNAKMRVCKYLVLQEVSEHAVENEKFTNNPVYSTDTSEEDEFGTKPTGQKFWSVRDSSGKFTKRS